MPGVSTSFRKAVENRKCSGKISQDFSVLKNFSCREEVQKLDPFQFFKEQLALLKILLSDKGF